MQICAATRESSMELPQKIKNGTALWPSDSTSGNIWEEIWNTILKEYKHPNIHCSITFNSQDLEAAQVDQKLWCIYMMYYYLAIKKKEILPFVTAWMDLENIMLSEISQSE